MTGLDLAKIFLYIISLGIFYAMTSNVILPLIAVLIILLIELPQHFIAKKDKPRIQKAQKMGFIVGISLSVLFIIYVLSWQWIYPNKPDMWKWGFQILYIPMFVPPILIFSSSLATAIAMIWNKKS